MISDFQESYIERSKHDKENPYTMIRNDLIRDNSITPNCRAILIYILSHDKNWKIYTSQLIKSFSPHIGRDLMYAILDEAIKAGYLKRETFFVNNLKRYFYVISEERRFAKTEEKQELKKFFRYTGSQETGNTGTSYKEITTIKKESISPPLSFSVDKSNPAVVKAPAQRTLPPDPVAKTVASAPKPSQSDVCSKSAPPAGDAKSVADAPSDDMIFFKEKFKKKHNITLLNEVAFEKAYERMKKVPKIDNPVLYILPIYEQFIKESENSIPCDLIKKRKEFALKRENGPKAPCGVWFVDKDCLCFQSSSEFAKYAFDKNLEFWDQHGLGLAFKKTSL